MGGRVVVFNTRANFVSVAFWGKDVCACALLKEFDGCDLSILRRRLRKPRRCWTGAADLTTASRLVVGGKLACSLIAQGSDFRTVSESSRTRNWYEEFNVAMKEEVETARNKGNEALVFGVGVPMDGCLCVL